MRHNVCRVLSLGLLVLAAFLLLVLHERLFGWGCWLGGVITAACAGRDYAKHILLIFVSVAALASVPINTEINPVHVLQMGAAVGFAVGMPYVVTRFVYKDHAITFPVKRHTWTREHIGYLLLTAALGYFILPFWMRTTGAYENWYVALNPTDLTLMFIGVNVVGIWDELFFIITVLALLRRHLPFMWANLVQAALFTAFLYELGFTGGAPLFIYPFALLQGLVFRRTENLLYIVAIHLTLDLVLYLALINAYHPNLINIFITA